MTKYCHVDHGHDPGEDALGWMGRVWSEYAFLFNQKTGQLAEIGDTAGIFQADCPFNSQILQDVEQIPREIVRETYGKSVYRTCAAS